MAENEFKPIETQEAFDNAIRERLDRQSRKHSEELGAKDAEIEALKASLSEFENLKNSEAEYATKLSELDNTVNELKKSNKGYQEQIQALTFAAVKRNIADEHGLTAEAREFLTGETEDELHENAEKLKKLVGSKPTAPLAGSEPTTEESYFTKKYGNNPFYKK